jgi:hypothetical protein
MQGVSAPGLRNTSDGKTVISFAGEASGMFRARISKQGDYTKWYDASRDYKSYEDDDGLERSKVALATLMRLLLVISDSRSSAVMTCYNSASESSAFD